MNWHMLLLALYDAAPAGTVLTQAHPAFGPLFGAVYATQPDPLAALDADTSALVEAGLVVKVTVDLDGVGHVVTPLGAQVAAGVRSVYPAT